MNDIYDIAVHFLLFIFAPFVFINLIFSMLKWAVNAPYEREVHTTTKKWFYE